MDQKPITRAEWMHRQTTRLTTMGRKSLKVLRRQIAELEEELADIQRRIESADMSYYCQALYGQPGEEWFEREYYWKYKFDAVYCQEAIVALKLAAEQLQKSERKRVERYRKIPNDNWTAAQWADLQEELRADVTNSDPAWEDE